MFRKPIYLIFFVAFLSIIFIFQISYINVLERKIESLETQFMREIREITNFKGSYSQLYGVPERALTYIDMRDLGTIDKKMSFLEELFQSYAREFRLQSEVKVEPGTLPEFMQALSYADGINVYRVNIEIQNYPNINTLINFLEYLKVFPVLFNDFEIGTGGEKKAYIRLSFNFFETYEE